MKKFILISLALAAVVSMSACDGFFNRVKNSADDLANESGLYNPFKHYDTVDEINAAAGVNLRVPEGIDAKDESFSTIDNEPVIADCSFNVGEQMYSIRAAATQNDITGIMIGSTALGDTFEKGTNITPSKFESGQETDEFFARWFIGDVQYVLFSLNATEDQFNSVYEAVVSK